MTEPAARGTPSSAGLRVLAQHDLGGHGDGMQVIRAGDALYVGHLGTSGMGTSILDVADPARPVLVAQWPAPPGTHTHKVQVAGGLLLVNHEKFPYRAAMAEPFSAGLAVYRLGDPLRPERIGFGSAGLAAKILTRIFQGNHWLFQCESECGPAIVIRQNDGEAQPAEGEAVRLAWRVEDMSVRAGAAA